MRAWEGSWVVQQSRGLLVRGSFCNGHTDHTASMEKADGESHCALLKHGLRVCLQTVQWTCNECWSATALFKGLRAPKPRVLASTHSPLFGTLVAHLVTYFGGFAFVTPQPFLVIHGHDGNLQEMF